MNYIGSKYSLLDFLTETICAVVGENLEGAIFADLFAGTGAVGGAFRAKGCSVISNDIQHYSFALNRHIVENTPPIEPIHLAMLNSLNGIEGFVYQNYCAGSGSGRNYFTDINGKKCDAIRSELNRLKVTDEISDDEYYYYLAGLINSIDRVANTASVYGAFLKHIKKSAEKDLVLEPLPIVDGLRGRVFNSDISSLIRKIKGEVLYLDPPYNARQYCSNYHVLETISKYDNPRLVGKTGLRDYALHDQRSAFCSKRTVAKAFDEVIANADFKYIALSYNNEGLLNLDTIRSIMSNYGKYEPVGAQVYRRFRADKADARNHKAETTTEYLHILVK